MTIEIFGTFGGKMTGSPSIRVVCNGFENKTHIFPLHISLDGQLSYCAGPGRLHDERLLPPPRQTTLYRARGLVEDVRMAHLVAHANAARRTRGRPGGRRTAGEYETARHSRDVYRQAFSRRSFARFTNFDNRRNNISVQYVLLLSRFLYIYIYIYSTRTHAHTITPRCPSSPVSLSVCAILMELRFKRPSVRMSTKCFIRFTTANRFPNCTIFDCECGKSFSTVSQPELY